MIRHYRGCTIELVPSRGDWVASRAEDDGVLFLGRFASAEEAKGAIDVWKNAEAAPRA